MSVAETTNVDVVNPVPPGDDVEIFQAHASGPRRIALSLIKPADIALRGVNRESVEYQTLLRSVRAKGVLNSILVREQQDPVTRVITYALIDGLQRFTAACDSGQIDIPANVVAMDDGEALEAQIITNVTRVTTKPAEYAKALLRILNRNPMMTQNQLAEKLCQSVTWLNERLSLTDLHPDIQKLVDNNQMNLSNAYALAKLPKEEQVKEVDAAIAEAPATFIVRMKNRVKEIREAKKAGKDTTETTFVPVAHVQKPAVLKEELETCAVGTALLGKNGLTGSDAQRAWKLAIEWVMHKDEDSVAEQKAAYEARLAERKAAEEKRKIEKEKKKQEEAAKKQADITQGL